MTKIKTLKKESYKVLGVMSGTSLDGIDLAVCTFVPPETSGSKHWEYSISKAKTIVYPLYWKNKLHTAVSFDQHELEDLNEEYTTFLADIIRIFISDNQIENLDAICSHGHTILHQPQNEITLQIGNLPKISALLMQKVVCDFRAQDVAMGGQGAPLVPIGDQLLFSDYDYCLNLGGFANVSLDKEGTRIAYDICPVNIVLNSLCKQLGKEYDDQGKIARLGKVNEVLLRQLNGLEFYNQAPPKSLGLEWVKEQLLPLIDAASLSIDDAIATFTTHAAQQIASQFKENSRVLVTGGGAYNVYLLELIQRYRNVQLQIPNEKLLEFKEALIFGFLGVLKLRGEVNCLASVTGASEDHSSGVILNEF